MLGVWHLKRNKWPLVVLLACIYSAASWAIKDIHVVALFKDRAIVMIDGKQRLLRAGNSSPEGVRLVSADSAGAVFEYQGRILERQLDGRVHAAAESPKGHDDVLIFRDRWGMFKTVGSINGLPVKFLVDTGASSVAMNSAQARRLGIDFLVQGEPIYVSTASDVTQAFQLKLDVVKVGSIQLRNVTAVVMDGAQPTEVLLGMSFLGHLEMLNKGDKLILRRKY
ncbi:MAG: retropepsin-like aspartic protease family protein [Thiogranum sp.]